MLCSCVFGLGLPSMRNHRLLISVCKSYEKKPFGSPKGYACVNKELGYCLSRSSPPRRASALYNVKVTSLSHLKKSLNPTIPVLPMGISRYFWAVASVRIGASPNKAWFGFPHTMYYGISCLSTTKRKKSKFRRSCGDGYYRGK